MKINNAQRFVFSSLLLVVAIEFKLFSKWKKIWDLAFTNQQTGGGSSGSFPAAPPGTTGGGSFGTFSGPAPQGSTSGNRPILTV